MREVTGWQLGRLADAIASLDAGVSVNSEDRPCGAGEVGILKTSALNGGVFQPAQHKTVLRAEQALVAEPVLAESILVSRMNTPALVGESCYVKDAWPDLFVPDRIWQLKPKDRGALSMRWLSYVLRGASARAHIDIHATGTSGSMKNLPKSGLLSLPIAYPSLPEQVAMAGVLDTLDTTIRQTEAIIEKLKQVKQGLLHDLLTRGIDANGELRPPQREESNLYKHSPLGRIPKDWRVEALSACTEKITDRDHTTPVYMNEGVLMVSPVNLFEDEGIDFSSAKRITARAHQINRKKTDLETGDLIIHRIGAGLGRVRLISSRMPPFSILHSMAQIRPRPDAAISEFLLWGLRDHRVQLQIELGTQSIGVPDLGLDKIGSMLVVVPPLLEQKEIAERMAVQQESIEWNRAQLSKLSGLKSGLMDDLLTGRVRVSPLLSNAVSP